MNYLKYIFVIALILGINSCSVYKPANYLPGDKIHVSEDAPHVVNVNIENKNYEFLLSSLIWFYYQDNLLPVINKNSPSMILGNMEGVSLVNFRLWDQEASYFVRRYVKDLDLLVFTVPGSLIVCMSKKRNLEELRPKPECYFSAISLENQTTRYFCFDYDMAQPLSPLQKDGASYIYRSIVEDNSKKTLVVIDYILVEGSDYMFTLVYPINGRHNYVIDSKRKFVYSPYSIRFWDPINNASISYQEVSKKCDPVSFSLINSLKNK